MKTIVALLLLDIVVQPTKGIWRIAHSCTIPSVKDVYLNGGGKLDMAELTEEFGAEGAEELMHFADSNADQILEDDEIVALEKYAESQT
ncbi:uncharacterized protein [Haliotis asinina]|uniref:uncharacterized protein n=1 Tax=Haliotis asinina TaxID=109174 RepID=UPI0035318FBB